MRTKLVSTLMLLYCCNGFPQVRLDESEKVSVLSVVVVDSFGRPVRGPTIYFEHRADGKTLRVFRGESKISLNYGEYVINIEKAGFESISKTVIVKEPVQMIIMGLTVGEIEKSLPVPVVRGQVADFGRLSDCPWVRFMALFDSDRVFDVSISDRGTFTVSGMKPGTYLVAVIGAGKICGITEVPILYRPIQDITVSLPYKAE